MTLIDRFTRDRVSRYIWAVLTVACLSTAFFAARQQRTARSDDVTNAVAAAQAQALEIANTVLFTNLSYATMIAPIPAPLYHDIIVALEGQAFTDTNIARVRVWRPDGTLQFSTHERDQVGLLKTQDTTLITQSMKGATSSEKVVTRFSAASTATDQVQTTLLEVYVPLHVPDRISVTGVAEVDYYYDTLVQPTSHPWFKLFVVFLVLAGLCLIMTLLSLRKPVRTVGAGVAFGLEGELGESRRSGKHAGASTVDKAAKMLSREAELAGARAAKAEAETTDTRERLRDSQDRLKQAEEANRLLEAKWKQGQADLEVAPPPPRTRPRSSNSERRWLAQTRPSPARTKSTAHSRRP